MNDFTKEELSIMADGIVLIKRKCQITTETLSKLDLLDKKLCSIINNYCEHDMQYASGEFTYCSKCMVKE